MPRRNNLFLSAIALSAIAVCLAFSSLALAQGPSGPGPGMRPGGPPLGLDRPPMERAFHDGHFGRWWNDPRLAQQLNISDDQKHKMDDIFLQHRLKLIDLTASLEKQEVLLRPMLEADQPDESKVLAQIDSIAQARADLEKANARMLFDIRKVLTPDQWKKLKAMREEHRPGEMADRMRHGDRGPGDRRPGAWRERHQLPPDGAAPPPPAPDAGSGSAPGSQGAPAAPPQ